jgi:hypothetical protein
VIAHLTFAGGGLLIPADTPYDRQLLREHVLSYARHKEQLRLSVKRKVWQVERPTAQRSFTCERCDRRLTIAALSTGADPSIYCVACALR